MGGRRWVSALAAFLALIAAPLLSLPAAAYDPPGLSRDAGAYETAVRAKAPPQPNTQARDAALQRASTALGQGNFAAAITAYEQALTQGDYRSSTWLLLSDAWQGGAKPNAERALQAAYNAYTASDKPKERAQILLRIGQILENRLNRLPQAMEAYEEGLTESNELPELGERALALRRKIGLTVKSVRVDTESEPARACITFSNELSQRRDVHFEDYVKLEPAVSGAVDRSGDTLCLAGLDYGRSYAVTLREGLPGADGFALKKTETQNVAVGNRKPRVAFRAQAYILPRNMAAEGLPVVTVNVDELAIKVYRINDRNLARQINASQLMSLLSRSTADEIENEQGRLLWKGRMTVQGQRNKQATTVFPLSQVVERSAPGMLVVTAEPYDSDPDGNGRPYELATQWVVVSDLGLTAMQGADGLNVFVRSLETAKALGDVQLSLVAKNNEELGKATTDGEGRARFAAGLMRGTGGAAPAAVMAYGANGDYVLLDLTAPAFDFGDRGVGGRAAPGPLDAFLYTERGVYRPGETVHLTALLRDDHAQAVETMPLTLKVQRPNGTVYRNGVVPPGPAGSFPLALDLADTAPRGTWTVDAYVDPKADPVGHLTFQVEDFIPEKLKVQLSAAQPVLTPAKPVEVTAETRFLYGPPAGGLPGTADLVLEVDPDPYPAEKGYVFGLQQEAFTSKLSQLPFPNTDGEGRSRVSLRLPEPPDTTKPLRATLKVAVSEPGGRPTNAALSLPVRSRPFIVGLRPKFSGGSVDSGQPAAFDVLAVGDGGPVAASLRWELYAERVDYQFFMRGGQLKFESTVHDERLKGGTVQTAAGAPVQIAESLGDGRYRLEVFDEKSGAATSLRFYAGWVAGPQAADTPDKVEVMADKAVYAPGEVAKIRVKPPFAGDLLLTVATDKVHLARTFSVAAAGETFEVPIAADWGVGAYIVATVLRPLTREGQRMSTRAVGLAWVGLDPSGRTLDVALEVPERAFPRGRVEIPVRVSAKEAVGAVNMTLAAVDEGILQLTDFKSPDPKAFYLGKRKLAVEVRDDYGRLIEAGGGPLGQLRQGGDADAGGKGLPAIPVRIVALFTGPVTLDAEGRGRVPLDLPDFNGELRLMAVAWDAARVGSTSSPLTVRDDLVAEATLPRFLAPGDESQMTLSLHNTTATAGRFSVTVTAEGPLKLDGAMPIAADLGAGERRSVPLSLRGTEAGIGRVALAATGPNGLRIERDWRITVRPARPPETQYQTRELKPGDAVTAERGLLQPYVPGTASVAMSVSTRPRFDVAGLIKALDRYPYGCLEQSVSRALPMLNLGELAAARDPKSAAQESPEARIDRTIARVLDLQRFDGSFSLWSARGDPEAWLSAYAMEFLARAKTKGRPVPEAPFDAGLGYLREQVDNGLTEPADLATRAYALYVMALAGNGRLGPLRYFADTFLDKLPTPLAKAQIGAALARLGDANRARAAFGSAMGNLARDYWPVDYGSAVRDAAALIVLLNEADTMRDRIPELVDRLPVRDTDARQTSTQEQAWLVMAAEVLTRGKPGEMRVTVNDRPAAPVDPVLLSFDAEQLAAPVNVRNAGAGSLWQGLTLVGVPTQAPAAARNGMRITRKFLARDGSPLNLDQVKQNDVFVVLMEGEAQTKLTHQALLVHPLPAGWEIENAKLGGASTGDLAWLGDLTTPRMQEARDDRYVAALDLTEDEPKFRLAYIVRAVTPGRYELPGAALEDMYRPRFFARQPVGKIAVLPGK